MKVIAERFFTPRATLLRVEAGVGIGSWAAALQALWLLAGLPDVVARDTVGQSLATAALSERVRLRRGGGVTCRISISTARRDRWGCSGTMHCVGRQRSRRYLGLRSGGA